MKSDDLVARAMKLAAEMDALGIIWAATGPLVHEPEPEHRCSECGRKYPKTAAERQRAYRERKRGKP